MSNVTLESIAMEIVANNMYIATTIRIDCYLTDVSTVPPKCSVALVRESLLTTRALVLDNRGCKIQEEI